MKRSFTLSLYEPRLSRRKVATNSNRPRIFLSRLERKLYELFFDPKNANVSLVEDCQLAQTAPALHFRAWRESSTNYLTTLVRLARSRSLVTLPAQNRLYELLFSTEGVTNAAFGILLRAVGLCSTIALRAISYYSSGLRSKALRLTLKVAYTAVNPSRAGALTRALS